MKMISELIAIIALLSKTSISNNYKFRSPTKRLRMKRNYLKKVLISMIIIILNKMKLL